ncbi:MAG: 16S rRNA (uracil(1498)-N(3))-methyltransferase [Clostridia bacterium]|nr:16S rRNA (uracil(1498)-N(3))-methyltransferase [Clostridia bacterium]
MPRFFIEGAAASPGDVLAVTGEDARHIASSLRMRPGEPIVLCDGRGTDFFSTVTGVGAEVTVRVDSVSSSVGEPPYGATVYQAAVKGDRFDTVVEKAVECGASSVVPFVSSRCVSRPDPKDAPKKIKRWEKIAREAAMQSGRGAVPTVGGVLSFTDMLREAAKADVALFCWERATVPLRDVLKGKKPSTVSVVIGPEGGFSDGEAAAAENAGLVPVSLGSRILRTETASGSVLSVLSYEFDV